MLKLLKMIKRSGVVLLILAAAFIVLQVYCDLQIPVYMQRILKIAMSSGTSTSSGTEAMEAQIPGTVLYLLLSFGASAMTVILSSRAISTLIVTIRKRLFDRVQVLSAENIDSVTTISLVNLCTSDLLNIQVIAVSLFTAVVKVPLIMVWVSYRISQYSFTWIFAIVISGALYAIFIAIILVKSTPHVKKLQKQTDRISMLIMQKLSGLDVIRAFNAQDATNQTFQQANEEMYDSEKKSQLPNAMMVPGSILSMSIMYPYIYLVGAFALSTMAMDLREDYLSAMLTFTPYAFQFMSAFSLLVLVIIQYPKAKVSAGRINEILNLEPVVRDGSGAAPREEGTVRFSHVSFTFPGAKESFIRDLDFECKKGSTVAVIGPTGCGKTTLINLLMRFYDVTEGEVFLDGVNVREYPLKELRQRISLTQQKAVLFSGTLASNVVYGCEDKRDDIDYIRAAGYASGSDEFVSQIPEEYETTVSRGGSNFSGGQRQRISIARTVAKPAEILIFDDSFSALDFKTDRTVRDRLSEKYPDQTKIIVAQRIGTILDADQILVMENGQIVGKGTHRELLSSCQTYREIAESQLSQEELPQ